MRIVDADEVKKAFIGNRYGTKAIEYVINNVPTVKAIPIEWIKEWLGKLTDPYDDSVYQMLEDWEKQN